MSMSDNIFYQIVKASIVLAFYGEYDIELAG
jgi:hypothetical protein